jgi:hypothetical protein
MPVPPARLRPMAAQLARLEQLALLERHLPRMRLRAAASC